MPQFIMPHDSVEGVRLFNDLDTFTQAYVECVFFTECHGDNPELEDATFEDLAAETLASIVEDCKDFQACYATLLSRAYEVEGYDEERAGHDYWLTRNGHGAGFWDRGLGEVGQRLTCAAKADGSRDAYRGDDGKVYLS
ncbi:hypothetical protein JQ617_07925 [Bradyrhizobium sp. KB893862 SZCCT0404]|uniref:hypothetical protein n=1 Tax=Bradyrhizobium sp. KB893862 SZCCT0404 TaxID=2807672 RepID=UPI001BAD9A93|nr:hypothetical protein [Bradyrhizobium sp. KB893862 SZCCT0404]MBR1173878.1 hypothetical protein [Bradyrhizobium sp. KB893862 SZCCT0404]